MFTASSEHHYNFTALRKHGIFQVNYCSQSWSQTLNTRYQQNTRSHKMFCWHVLFSAQEGTGRRTQTTCFYHHKLSFHFISRLLSPHTNINAVSLQIFKMRTLLLALVQICNFRMFGYPCFIQISDLNVTIMCFSQTNSD